MISTCLIKNLDSILEFFRSSISYKDLTGKRVFIKPNLVCSAREYHILPFGVVTTTRIIEALTIYLKECGSSLIKIGEGSVHDTKKVFHEYGYDRLQKKYDVKLIDLKDDIYDPFTIDGITIEVARNAIENDIFINVPVLKYHLQTNVSLGMKNLKGCISPKSRKESHQTDLHKYISILPDIIPVHYTIVDGTFQLFTNNPSGVNDIQKRNMILLSNDIFECDYNAARLFYAEPFCIPYLYLYAKKHGIPISGDSLTFTTQQNFDTRICSGCTNVMIVLSKILNGNVSWTVGSCCKDPAPIHINGCPPTVKQVFEFLKFNNIPYNLTSYLEMMSLENVNISELDHALYR